MAARKTGFTFGPIPRRRPLRDDRWHSQLRFLLRVVRLEAAGLAIYRQAVSRHANHLPPVGVSIARQKPLRWPLPSNALTLKTYGCRTRSLSKPVHSARPFVLA